MTARRFRGFAVTERPGGALIWGTFRPNAADAWAMFDKWNPSAGLACPAELVEIELTVRPAAKRTGPQRPAERHTGEIEPFG